MVKIERILLTPRWAGTTESDWYPWILEELGEPPIRRVALPEPSAPTIEGAVAAFLPALLEGDPETTLCVGHSVSVQAWLHTFAAFERERPGQQSSGQVAGLIGVAGWWSVDAPWPTLLPWQEAEHDLAAIRRVCPRIRILLGADDPFTSDQEANAALWRERLGAEVRIVEGAKHFNGAKEPVVLEWVKEMRGGE